MPIAAADVNSYAELNAFLQQLPPPPPGTRRMFRGQTRGYRMDDGTPKLLPALARDKSDHTYDPAWLVSIQMYSMVDGAHGPSTPYDQVFLWGPALLQHYGPGSSYLDVTADLDVALWFAIYKRWEKWLAIRQPDGEVRSHCCSWYTPADFGDPATAPLLYVFDSPSWNGQGAPAHAELVELTSLGVAGKLPQEARRLHCQVGSLIYADLKHAGGPNLGPAVMAMARLQPAFDLASIPSSGRPVAEVFPPPATDAFYRALLQVPAQLYLEPRRIENPLALPCYLNEAPTLPASAVAGDREHPLILTAEEAACVAGLDSFLALGDALNPTLMYAFALAQGPGFSEPVVPTTDDGTAFHLADATTFLLEGPLWSFLPTCHLADARGEWIQSALPIGIAEELAGRSTANIYMELSTIDVQYPRKQTPEPAQSSSVRGIWTVRAGNRYWCTTYRTADGGVFSMAAEFRFIADSGIFIRVPSEKEKGNTQAQADLLRPFHEVIEKALYTSLLFLRELSPGWKPPSTFAGSIYDAQGACRYRVGQVLEPQLGLLHMPAGSSSLVPRALNGGIYARASGSSTVDRDGWRKSDEGLEALLNAVRHMKEPLYLIEAGAELAGLLAERSRFQEALEITRYALAQIEPGDPFTQGFAGVLHALQGRALAGLKDGAGPQSSAGGPQPLVVK